MLHSKSVYFSISLLYIRRILRLSIYCIHFDFTFLTLHVSPSYAFNKYEVLYTSCNNISSRLFLIFFSTELAVGNSSLSNYYTFALNVSDYGHNFKVRIAPKTQGSVFLQTTCLETESNCTEISLDQENTFDVESGCLPITIQSIYDITVHGLVYTDTQKLTGGFLALPHSFLGEEYIIDSYASDESRSKIFIAAIEDDTTIEVSAMNPSVKFQFANGTSLENIYHLNSGEYAEIKPENDKGNITGTRISSNGKIAVVSSSSNVNIPSSTESDNFDHGFTIEQFIPLSNWGYRHIVPQFSGTSGWVAHIMTNTSNTNASLTGYCGSATGIVYIPTEGYELINDMNNDNASSVCVIVANEHVQVVQFMKSSPRGGPEKGDPSMVLIPPVSAFHGHTTFSVSISDDIIQYIGVIVRDTGKSGMLLNGSSLADEDDWDCFNVSNSFCETSVTTFCYYATHLRNGTYSVTHPSDSEKFSLRLFTYRDVVIFNQGSIGAAMLADISGKGHIYKCYTFCALNCM